MPPIRPSSRVKQLYSEHRAYYERFEKNEFDRSRAYYQGRFATGAGASGSAERAGTGPLYATKNIIYAVADSATAALLGSNPTVSPKPLNLPAQAMMMPASGLLEWVFSVCKMRRRSATTLMDSVLCKRGVFKTGWDAANDRPIIRAVDPTRLFFDLTARDPDDIGYFLETTVLPWSSFETKVAAGRYRMPSDLRPDSYPRWLFDHSAWDRASRVHDVGAWVNIIEFYDRDRGRVVHYNDQTDEVVFEAETDYFPYDMYVLNHSGTDCLGLSEVQLILDQQQTVNDMLTLLKRIAYLQMPRTLFDKGRVTGEDLNKAVAASVGAFVGIRLKNPELGRNLAAAFFPMPYPEHPEGVVAYKSMTEDDAAFISALAKSARGEIGNARTATEMAIIEAQLKMRLASREGNLNEAMEGVAAKAFWLCQRFMSQPKLVRVSGSKWTSVSHESLRDIEMEWKMVAHNPIRNNPAVMAETLIQVMPILQVAPNVDQLRLAEEVVNLLGLPQRILIPEDEARALMAAAAGAAQPPAPEAALAQEQSPAAAAGVPGPEEPDTGSGADLWRRLADRNFGVAPSA